MNIRGKTIDQAKGIQSIFIVCLFGIMGFAAEVNAQTWARTYGGGAWDNAEQIIQTNDGGCAVIGYTNSFGAGYRDFWMLRLDASGLVIWENTFGGVNYEEAYSAAQTFDGGFVVAGQADSFGGGPSTFWVLKLDENGNIIWEKIFNGGSGDYSTSIIQTSDGGYVVSGYTFSFGAGSSDFWVLRLDSTGNIVWEKSYGSTWGEIASSIIQTSDGGFAATGHFTLSGGNADIWVLKLDALGNVSWQKTYGGGAFDEAFSLIQSMEGGYAVVGRTYSFGAGDSDIWVLKLDDTGNLTWQKTFGGISQDEAYAIVQVPDGGYSIAGFTQSFGSGNEDVWVITLDTFGNIVWQKTFGGVSNDVATSITKIFNSGYLVSGQTSSVGAGNSDLWLLRMDENGDIDSSCIFIQDTVATVMNTAATVTDTTATVTDTLATVTDTSATATVSSASIGQQCYGCTSDAYEPDNNCYVTKSVIHGGETQAHNFCDDTEDWVSFNACTGRSYTIETANFGALADVMLELYGTDCFTPLASDYAGPGIPALINWTAPADGTYHIKASQFDATTGKDREYDLTLTGNTNPCSTWARTYGGSLADGATSLFQTTTDGYIVLGPSLSFGAGVRDYLLITLDSEGNVIRQKTFGEVGDDLGWSTVETLDGGLVLAGYSGSIGVGGFDVWIIKLDSSGNILWQNTYGGGSDDRVYSVEENSMGDLFLIGRTDSFGVGNYDAWVIKIDAFGNILWEKSLGGVDMDWLFSGTTLSDGGVVCAGRTRSFGAGSDDIWILRMDQSGDILWQKTLGGNMADEALDIIQTSDGGYIIVGSATSFNAGSGGSDLWVVKLNSIGDVVWQKAYGWNLIEYARSIKQLHDGGFILAGYTSPFGSDEEEAWVLRLDNKGNVIWQKIYGGSLYDVARDVLQVQDGGFVIAGQTRSFGSGDVDFWVLKTDSDGNIDSACDFIDDALATVTDTNATVTYTTAIALDTFASVTTPVVSGVNSAATVMEQCSRVVCETIPCEPSGAGGEFPLRVEKDAASATGYYLYFQEILDATGYNLYEGSAGAWYDHGAGGICDLVVGVDLDDLGTGELRYEITPSGSDHYYLVTAHDGVTETVSGYDSLTVERDPFQNTCAP